MTRCIGLLIDTTRAFPIRRCDSTDVRRWYCRSHSSQPLIWAAFVVLTMVPAYTAWLPLFGSGSGDEGDIVLDLLDKAEEARVKYDDIKFIDSGASETAQLAMEAVAGLTNYLEKNNIEEPFELVYLYAALQEASTVAATSWALMALGLNDCSLSTREAATVKSLEYCAQSELAQAKGVIAYTNCISREQFVLDETTPYRCTLQLNDTTVACVRARLNPDNDGALKDAGQKIIATNTACPDFWKNDLPQESWTTS